MSWLHWVIGAVLVAVLGYGLFWAIIVWVLSDAPSGTRMFGIRKLESREDEER